jgi:hypothetical protein
VSPVKYEQGFYIPEDDILHSHHCGNFKSYIVDIVGDTRERERERERERD